MPEITAAMVKSLRDKTNLPMMDCKKALVECDGDMEKAIEKLRADFKNVAIKKGEREAAEGLIGFYHDPSSKTAAIVEVRCESAPVTKSDAFIKLCEDIAKQIVEKNPKDIDDLMAQKFIGDEKLTISDRLTEVIGLIQENMKVARFHRGSGEIGTYLHHDGSVGVLLEVEGENADPTVLKDICMHIAATNPPAGTREDLPAEMVEKEKALFKTQMDADPKNAKKPANIIENILTGKLNKWYGENVLLEQPFVKDDSKKVGDLLKAGNLKFVRFTRYRVGEVVE